MGATLSRPASSAAAVQAYARVQAATVEDLQAEIMAATELRTRPAGRGRTGNGLRGTAADRKPARLGGRAACPGHGVEAQVGEDDKALDQRYISVVQFYRLYYEMEMLSSSSQDALYRSMLNVYRRAGEPAGSTAAAAAARSADPDLDECVICMERPAEVSLHCTHSYCSDCIKQWSSEHTECPLCRGEIGSVDDAWVLQGTPTSREMGEDVHHLMRHISEHGSADT